jgi:hypothetical protein
VGLPRTPAFRQLIEGPTDIVEGATESVPMGTPRSACRRTSGSPGGRTPSASATDSAGPGRRTRAARRHAPQWAFVEFGERIGPHWHALPSRSLSVDTAPADLPIGCLTQLARKAAAQNARPQGGCSAHAVSRGYAVPVRPTGLPARRAAA